MRIAQELQSEKCLHIGCGLNAPTGWENIDASPTLVINKIPLLGSLLLPCVHKSTWPKSIKYGDIVKGLNVKENSYDLVFASHVLEHLTFFDFQVALKNIYFYLKPGGFFRFIVPDLKQYINTYISQSSDPKLSEIAAEEFLKSSLLGHQGSRKNLFSRWREAMANSRHQWMWDEPSLIKALSSHQFRNIRQCHYGDWSDPKFSLVESKLSYANSLGIEAIK